DGTATVSQGGRLEGVGLAERLPAARVTENGWILTTARIAARSKGEKAKAPENLPVAEGRANLMLADAAPSTQVEVKTEQGSFSFRLDELPYGVVKPALKGLVQISRVPNSARIVSAPTEDDCPAAAYGKDGKLYVAYQSFTHGKDFARAMQLDESMKDFSVLAEPTGGDQIFLIRLDGAKWSAPMEVTPPKQDVYRLAMAADGAGKVWVAWSANVGENWDICARGYDGSAWSNPIRLSDDAGPDVLPAAAADAEGRVWIAWQGFRNGRSNIFAVRQEGGAFGKPLAITETKADDWAPALAAAANGDVAFTWDTYQNGNFDVYARVWSKGNLTDLIPIATSLEGQSRPSAAYDRQGRLWVAYEESPENWGKDYGFYEKTGASLYMARGVKARVWADGRLMEPAEQPFAAVTQSASQAAAGDKTTMRNPMVKYADPRIACDAAGRVWLSGRRGISQARSTAGSIWGDVLIWYDGAQWSSPISCPETDGTLDVPPALVPRPNGGLVIVSATDGRLATAHGGGARRAAPQRPAAQVAAAPEKSGGAPDLMERAFWTDPINGEIAMAVISNETLQAPPAPELRSAEATPPPMTEAAKAEAEAIARMRSQRATAGGKTLQIARGEFHRHTELSGDGGGDGMLLDTWRYAHDMADHDWMGNGDHDNGGGREYSWWQIQKTTSMFRTPGAFEPMFTYERSVSYPDGHRNVVFPTRGVRPLPRFRAGMGKDMDAEGPDAPRPHSEDTLMLYRYLKAFDGVCASHTSGTKSMGTDWRDNDREVEPVVEIYQGDRDSYEMPGAPRAVSAEKSAAGFRPFGFVSLALKKGYRLGFQASSDHISVHMSYCNVWTESLSREAIFDALKKRHVYGATDNIVAEFHCGDHFMGDEFEMSGKPAFHIRIVGAQPIAKVDIVRNGEYVYNGQPNQQEVEFDWTDSAPLVGQTSYYYVRGEQSDGELCWLSPMWITVK
ncbi:MAG: hypothetical protein NTW86_10120, partial [Candidatus Sumerlaeota bacterium]|nr:hypothetical protein [Candidatus Sumerlaeota bacterium]